MKKNFLKVAALLIAAMLLVVSCSQEVAPKNEDNGLKEAKLNVAFGKAINIAPENQNANIYYEYTLKHMWDNLNSGVVYGDGTYEFGTGTYSTAPNSTNTASVTPGLWKVEVKGYLTDDEGKKNRKCCSLWRN